MASIRTEWGEGHTTVPSFKRTIHRFLSQRYSGLTCVGGRLSRCKVLARKANLDFRSIYFCKEEKPILLIIKFEAYTAVFSKNADTFRRPLWEACDFFWVRGIEIEDWVSLDIFDRDKVLLKIVPDHQIDPSFVVFNFLTRNGRTIWNLVRIVFEVFPYQIDKAFVFVHISKHIKNFFIGWF